MKILHALPVIYIALGNYRYSCTTVPGLGVHRAVSVTRNYRTSGTARYTSMYTSVLCVQLLVSSWI